MAERRQIVISRWASQASRVRAALEPGYVGIDERSFPELLAFAPSFARHVRYVAADNRPDGDWSDFFLADSAMVLASMAVFDATDRSRRFHEASRRVQSENSDALKLEHLKTLFDVILALPRQVEAWYAAAETLRGDTAATALRALLASAIGRELAPLLAQLRSYGVGAGQPGALGHAIPVDCRHFQPIWQAEFVCPDGSIYRGHFRRQKINAALGPLTSLYEFLLGAVSDLTDRARRDFASGFTNGSLKPHIALYVAFIKQFQVAQSRLNELPARVVDFYYREVLHEPLRPPVPDQMFLSFTRAPGITPAKVPRGTQFPAGADALGRPVLFLADQTLDVTRARLARVRAMRITRGPLCDGVGRDAPASSTGHLHRVNVTNFLVGPDGGSPDGKPWAPFSAAVGSIGTMPQQAPLGFAIASPSLLLAGGQRNITVSLHYSQQTGHATLDSLLAEIADATGLSADKALTQMLMEAFGFSVTTPTGWYEIVPCCATASLGEQIIAFQFDMPPGAPPLVAAEPALAGAQFDNVSAPVLRARLRQDPVTFIGSATVKVHPLSLLEGLRVEDVVIEIGVTDLPGVTIKTRGGPVDPTMPFLPFGAPARPGAWFEIQHRELFTKPLDRITVSIDWLGLPADPRGFAGHYEQYVVGPDRRPNFPNIGNDSFRAAPMLIGDAPWSLSGDSGPVYLFRTDKTHDVPEASGPLEVRTVLGFTAKPPADAALPASPGAALRITLMDPPFGFGDELYSPNVLYAIHFVHVPPVRRRGLLCRLLDFILGRPVPTAIPPDVSVLYPNPPWQPEIASLSIGYHSTTRLDLRDAQTHEFLHLLPSGVLLPATPDQSRIPLLAAEGPRARAARSRVYRSRRCTEIDHAVPHDGRG